MVLLMPYRRLLMACLMLFLWGINSGCLIVANDNSAGDKQCYDDCFEYEVCESYCDARSCWDECWWQSDCSSQCSTNIPEYTPPVVREQCFRDQDCPDNSFCSDNKCRRIDEGQADEGHSGLCQVCDNRNDCGEPDALCIQLNFDQATRTGEKVCSRACQYNHDCPTGFECINISSEPDIPAQCLPIQGTNEKRTCNPSPDLECIRANDCPLGESCVNNHCVGPEDAECAANRPCDEGQVCRNHQCELITAQECINRADCAARELCIDGECVVHNNNCVFNDECDQGALCHDGLCVATCEQNDECGAYEHCLNGLCQEIQCRRNADCAVGTICVDAQCETGCEQDDDCDNGYLCSASNYCTADPAVECRSTSECASDEICVQGACLAACTCGQECASGEICDMDTGICEQIAPDEGQPMACESECDCPGGQQCVEEVCVAD